MKTFRIFGLVMMLVMGMGFTSCSDDDDDEPSTTGGAPSDVTDIVGSWKLYEEDEYSFYEQFLDIYSDNTWEMEWSEVSFTGGGYYSGDDYGTYRYSNGKVTIVSEKYSENGTPESDTYIVTMPNNNTLVLREIDDDEGDTYTRVVD